jgi:hypothetical protein
MSDFKWGKLSVYVYDKDNYVRIYYWKKMTMFSAHYTLNSDNSLNESNQGKTLLPAEMWHEVAKHSDKIITYLMLKRK